MSLNCSFQLVDDNANNNINCLDKDGGNSSTSVVINGGLCHHQPPGLACVTIGGSDDGGGNKITETIISPLIDNETKRILELYINVVGFLVTSSLGVFGNIINITVYWKQGLGDSITLGFFALSVSDLTLVAMPLFTGSLYAAKYMLPDSPIDFSSIHYVSFGWVRNFTYSCSLLITAFLALERCCCIMLPFKVQTLFTRRKTVVFLIVIFLFHVGCLCLLPAIMQLKWQPSSSATLYPNSSQARRLRVKFFEFGREIEVFYSTSMSFIVPLGCQVIVTVCAFVMVRGLRKASRFRAQATSAGQNAIGNDPTSSHPPDDKNRSASLSQRDARLVKTMIFLVSILSACNVPFLAATFAWRSVPDLNIGRPYQNTLSVVFSIVYILGNLNASSNVIVYYKTSSRFREVTKRLFTSPVSK